MTNNLKQLLISGYLGDGYISHKGFASFSSVHKEYIEFKASLADEGSKVDSRLNSGYKKTSNLSSVRVKVSEEGKSFFALDLKDKVESIDELGLALWFYDDGSRHKKSNFFNINTHSFSRLDEKNILIPLLNKFDIFPEIYTEKKKDGRVFSYLYVSKWKGAMEISRIMRKLDLPYYKYKLPPIEIEDIYFEIKDTKDFKNATTRRKTNIVKEYLNIGHSSFLGKVFETELYVNSDEL
jgi:hypothetical protein